MFKKKKKVGRKRKIGKAPHSLQKNGAAVALIAFYYKIVPT
jgi:hypothetical protein